MLKTDLYDYDLPPDRIANEPATPRDASRLLALNRHTGEINHTTFRQFPSYLKPGDLLVLNDTKVIPARLFGTKVPTGGKVELLLVERTHMDTWQCLARPARRMKTGTRLSFGDGRLIGTVVDQSEDGGRVVTFSWERGTFEHVLHELGKLPLPPYIKKDLEDDSRYQTVYARVDGAKAAPTAGLHFTPEMIQTIERAGVRVATVTLHVGLGTFIPVTTPEITDHTMHSEWYHVPDETARLITETKRQGHQVIAVGTTVARTLESAGDDRGAVVAGDGTTSIFIYPGYTFRVVDAMLTNFHLPRSTLLVMVSAFADRKMIMSAYAEAIDRQYRFFSFGDAMFIY